MSLSPDFISELRKHFSGDIRADLATRILYSTDASLYEVEPLGVAIPRTQDDLQAAVELAARHKLPILPRGSGSSLAGQAVGEALILDCSRYLDNILEINPEARTATVEPGAILMSLNKQAAKHGLMYGPDPASAERATFGGVIGNNATGAHSILYGMSADHILSADVLLSDGSLATLGELDIRYSLFDARTSNNEFRMPNDESRISNITQAALQIRQQYADAIRAHWPRSWRNSAGYRLNYLLPWSPSAPSQWIESRYPNLPADKINLAPLLAGSEGTLAVMRRLTVNLVKKPRHTILVVIPYESIAAACDDVPRLLEFRPSAIELIPQSLIRLARDVPAYARMVDFVDGDPAAILTVEFSGEDQVELEKQGRQLGEGLRVVSTPEGQNRIWAIRKAGLGLVDSAPTDLRPVSFIEDCAIPVEQLGNFVRELDGILAAHRTTAVYYAHVSAGCMHIRPWLDLRTSPGVTALRGIAQATLELTLRVGGAMSSEHGDGMLRSEFLRQTYGDEVMDAFRLLKRAADPHNILNPGKILDAPPMDTHLRYGAAYKSQAWVPALDFSGQGGLARAVEQCSGAGVCRKFDGVMCPSFQASREEQNSTRGRANLLRALLSSTAHPPSEVEKSVYDALGLCLACKGCKAECPSRVDMAKLKYEFLNEYYKKKPRPWRDFLFGYINQLAPLGAPFGGLVNSLLAQPAVARAFNRFFELSPSRVFPRFAKAEAAQYPPVAADAPMVLFLPDTFTHFFEPKIEQAALRIFAALGFRVQALPLLGAGRTLISKGFVDAARAYARRVVAEIGRLDPQGKLPIVGIEPSEIYTLRDEFHDLLPEQKDAVALIASRAWLAEEYLARQKERVVELANSRKTKIASEKLRVSLHGHCYQKAQPPAADGLPVGQAASAALLQAFGFEVDVIPSGCCGMAGAFGYEAEHQPLSMKVGEMVLFPAARAAQSAGRQVAAVGTSCRAQIADGTGVEARHPLTLIAGVIL